MTAYMLKIVSGARSAMESYKIVTCGECKYWHEGKWYNTCDKHIGHGFVDDYFCKDGERRTK